jgi:predicted O-methyltransferase YrrM
MVERVEFERIVRAVHERCRKESVYMLGPEKASFLGKLVLHTKPRVVVECGTALGYSALHIAEALHKTGQGRLITIEIDADRVKAAKKTFQKAGLLDIVDVRTGDAAAVLKEVDEVVDFLFLDNSFGNYYACLMSILHRLKDKATIVADNVGIGASSMKDYLEYVRSHGESSTHWFDLDLPWASRDAMEVSVYSV